MTLTSSTSVPTPMPNLPSNHSAFHTSCARNTRNSQREVEEVAMDVLNDQREVALAQIFLARLAHRAVGRIGPEGFVVRAAIVIASDAEAARHPQDQHRHRDEARHPGGHAAEPGVLARTGQKSAASTWAKGTGRSCNGCPERLPNWNRPGRHRGREKSGEDKPTTRRAGLSVRSRHAPREHR